MQNTECVTCIITSVQNIILKYSDVWQLYLKKKPKNI